MDAAAWRALIEAYLDGRLSPEAFARRFYSDRAELTALGVPLSSQRDEFTGEELYTLRSEHYFLERLELDDDELAALQTALYYLEGKFAYAEPLRLALQRLQVDGTRGAMVGDGVQDLRAGRAAGLSTIACLFGYGDPAALRALGADVYWSAFGVPADAH